MLLKDKSFIVSCQAESNDPFNTPYGVALFAKAAEMGGAHAIRSEGVEKTKEIIKNINLPVIGLIKHYFNDGTVCITRKIDDVQRLIDIGCGIIAVDGTIRKVNGLTGAEYISKLKSKFNIEIMADISSYEEGAELDNVGVDYVSTTLNGYTKLGKNLKKPNFSLVKQLASELKTPVIAEGRISTPMQVSKMISFGAYAVVVGTAITRPRLIVEKYVNLINRKWK